VLKPSILTPLPPSLPPSLLPTLTSRFQANGIHFAMEFLTKNQKRLMMTREGRLESGWDKVR
jgi:hypothetical protein